MACLIVIASALASAQSGAVSNAEDTSFRVGAVSLDLPAPSQDLVEMGSDYRVLIDYAVPSTNRLVAAFIPPDTLAEMKKGAHQDVRRYALVEVIRRFEFADLDVTNFQSVVDVTSKQSGTDSLNQAAANQEEEVNRKITAMGINTGKIAIDKPVQLGAFFSKQNAYGFGMMLPMSADGKTVNMVCGATMLRTKNRLLLVYIYSEYKDEATVHWVMKTSEAWADTILKSN
jgi:hypothetical protein